MYVEQEDIYYYITLLNEAYQHPAMPEGRRPAYSKACICCASTRSRKRKLRMYN